MSVLEERIIILYLHRNVVLIFVLDDKTLACEEVSLSLTPPAELDLEPLKVGLILHDFDERHVELQVFSRILYGLFCF